MYLQIGRYRFDPDSLRVTSRWEVKMSAGMFPVSRIGRLNVSGYIAGSGQIDLTAKQILLETALASVTPTTDIIFYCNNGAPSATKLMAANSLSGIIVSEGPHFEGTAPAEYVNQREFKFSAWAEYPVNGADGLLMNFHETLSMSGGGPLYIMRPALNGPPQKQLVYKTTPFVSIQSGSASGYSDYPFAPDFAPPPVFGIENMMKPVEIVLATPKRVGGGLIEYGTSWKYEFSATTRLDGLPNVWP